MRFFHTEMDDMDDESNTASTDTESESQLGITGSTQVSTSTQGNSFTQACCSTQGSSSTQGSTQDDSTPPSLTPTVPTRRRGRPAWSNDATTSSHSRSSSTSSSTRTCARRKMSSAYQLSTPSTTSSLQTPHSFDMTSTHSSIRDSARIPSFSTGVCQNVTHESSIFNINYRRRRQQSNATTGTNTNDSVNNNESLNASAADVNRDAISAAMMPPELPHAPNSPIHGMQNLDNTADDTEA